LWRKGYPDGPAPPATLTATLPNWGAVAVSPAGRNSFSSVPLRVGQGGSLPHCHPVPVRRTLRSLPFPGPSRAILKQPRRDPRRADRYPPCLTVRPPSPRPFLIAFDGAPARRATVRHRLNGALRWSWWRSLRLPAPPCGTRTLQRLWARQPLRSARPAGSAPGGASTPRLDKSTAATIRRHPPDSQPLVLGGWTGYDVLCCQDLPCRTAQRLSGVVEDGSRDKMLEAITCGRNSVVEC
jgi:hypothetical protein